MALAGCALVSVVTTVGIVIALLVPALEFFGEVNPARLPVRHQLGAALLARALRRAPARGGHAARDRLRLPGRAAARPRRRDLPGRVLVAPRARRDQAAARDPGRHPDGRLRLLRAHDRDAAAARPRPRRRGLQRALGRPRDGRDAAADGRLAVGGRDGRRAAGAAPGRLRAGREPPPGLAAHRRAGGALGHRRVVRARDLARRRRDDDRDDRGRPPADAHARPAHRGRDADGVHRLDRRRRRADRIDRVQDDLRRRPRRSSSPR